MCTNLFLRVITFGWNEGLREADAKGEAKLEPTYADIEIMDAKRQLFEKYTGSHKIPFDREARITNLRGEYVPGGRNDCEHRFVSKRPRSTHHVSRLCSNKMSRLMPPQKNNMLPDPTS